MFIQGKARSLFQNFKYTKRTVDIFITNLETRDGFAHLNHFCYTSKWVVCGYISPGRRPRNYQWSQVLTAPRAEGAGWQCCRHWESCSLGEGPQSSRARGGREGERAHITDVFMPCYVLLCAPHHCQICMLKPSPPELQNGTEFGDRAFKAVIQLKWGH